MTSSSSTHQSELVDRPDGSTLFTQRARLPGAGPFVAALFHHEIANGLLKGVMKRLKSAAWIVICLFVVTCVAHGQVQSDAMEVLENVAATYRAMTTFQTEEITAREMNGPNIQDKMERPTKLIVALPNRMRMESKAAAIDMLVIFDGKTMWMYMPQLNLYAKLQSPKTSDNAADAESKFDGAFGQYEKIAENAKAARILRSEVVSFDGSNVDCYVVEVEPNLEGQDINLGALGKLKIESALSDFWVAKDRFLVLRKRTDVKETPPGASAPTEIVSTTTFTKIKVNDPVPDSLFSFTPPEGATEMDLPQFLPFLSPKKE